MLISTGEMENLMKKMAILVCALLPSISLAGKLPYELLDEYSKIINQCLSETWSGHDQKDPQLCKDVAVKHEALVKKMDSLPGVRVGMSKNDVLTKTNWWQPESINVSTSQYGTREQWVYGGGNYLYFEGRDPAKLKLTYVQQGR
jgi:hypothetical protein